MANYRAIFEEMPDGVTLHDASDGAILETNQQFCEMLGYTREELLELGFEDLHVDEAPYTADRAEEYIQKAATEGPQTFEWRDETKSGEPLPVEVHLRLTTIDSEERVLAVVRDITERTRQEEQLARQQSLLEAQQEAVLDGMLVVDEDGQIISYNDRLLELWEVPEEIVEADDHGPLLDWAISRLANPEQFRERVEYLYEHPEETSRDEIELIDGRVLDRYSTPLVGEDGTHYGRLWTFRDITERLERERRLQRERNLLDEFASLVSHDLRNPLSVAQGRLELAREEFKSEHHEAIASAHERIEGLIDDVLTMARQGGEITELEPVDLDSLTERSWANVVADSASLEIETNRTIRADSNRLQQLLENLLRNSVEHGGDDVSITVGELEDGFFVEDDGPGIPADERADVFEAGYSTSDGGTGFGLSIVLDTINAHGWELDVTDRADGGVRFEIGDVETVSD